MLAKAASGALELVPVVRVVNIARTLDELGEMGFLRLAFADEAAEPIEQVDLDRDLVLVLGAEGEGLRRLTREKCDVAVVRFGDKYKQWNAAFDAGYCAALGKPYITLHADDIVHPLKEVDAAAMAWAETPAQVVEILNYVINA